MLRHVTVVTAALSALLPQATYAQAINRPGLDPCKMTLCCKKEEFGQVNKCAQYWTFKKVNPGDIVSVVNSDPGACPLAVKSNQDRLAEDFQSPFEVSVPNDAMWQTLSAMVVPEEEDLFPAPADVQALPSNQDLIPAIDAAIVRYPLIGRDWLAYLEVNAKTDGWLEADHAAERLSGAATGIIAHLARGGSWPTLTEFAPYVWDLAICKHNRAAEVALLKQRLATGSTDPARHFAFLGDLRTLTEPFGVSATGPALEAIASPFYTEPLEEVRRRKRESLFASTATFKFKAQADRLKAAVSHYTEWRVVQQQARKATIDGNFATETAATALLKDAYTGRRLAATTAEGDHEKAKADLTSAEDTLSHAETTRDDADEAFLAARLIRDEAAGMLDEAHGALDTASDKLDAALAALDAVTLNCDGAPYETCSNAAAKLAYDRATYHANQAVAAARATFVAELDSVQTATTGLLDAEKRIRDQQAKREASAEAVASALDERDAAEVAVTGTMALAETLKLEAVPLDAAMARLQALVDRIKQCLALTTVAEAREICVGSR